jgi:enoyl-CoA hydratase/carnithine racemase
MQVVVVKAGDGGAAPGVEDRFTRMALQRGLDLGDHGRPDAKIRDTPALDEGAPDQQGGRAGAVSVHCPPSYARVVNSFPRDEMDLAEATDLLGGAGLRGELLGALADRPLLIIDLDTPGDAAALHVPPTLPAVAVGVSRSPDLPNVEACGLDVALTARPEAPAPWVSCDPAEEVGLLSERASVNPVASVVLAHTLRASSGVPIGSGLLIESLAYSTLQGGAEFQRWLSSQKRGGRDQADADPVLVHRSGDRLTITLNRPAVHNSYNAEMRDRLVDVLTVVLADDSIKHVDLLGTGPSFCSGGDLTEFGTFTDPASAHLVRTGRSPAYLLSRVANKITAHVHGACIGSGLELPAFAGTVQADPATRFQLPEVAMGLIPGAGGTVSISQRIGAPRTAWLALSGRTIGAERAWKWGLVDEITNRVVGSDGKRY